VVTLGTETLTALAAAVQAAYARGTCQNLKGDFIEAIGAWGC
jgi:hypothetical protein